MDIKPDIQIQVMIKAMEDTVLPSVNREDPMAFEQANLVLKSLRVLQARLPIWFSYTLDELNRYIQLSAEVLSLVVSEGPAYRELQSASQEAERLNSEPGVLPQQMEESIGRCRTAIVRLMAEAEAAGQIIVGSEVGKKILDAAALQLQRERAWLVPFGFEADIEPDNDIEKQLAPFLKKMLPEGQEQEN